MKPGLYRHYKGGKYFVVGPAYHSESDDALVLYFPLYGENPQYWVRPHSMFAETVDVDGVSRPRFAFVRDANEEEMRAINAAGPAGVARHINNAASGLDAQNTTYPDARQSATTEATPAELQSERAVKAAQILSSQPSEFSEPAIQPNGWVQSIITILGAGIFGLGVILFFAYNWQGIPKFGKLAIVFSGVLLFHALGLFFGRNLTREQCATNTLTQGMHMLGTFLFSAGVFLIAQIYHIDEHYPNALGLWGVAALLFAWVLPSVWQGLLAVVMLTAWGIAEGSDYGSIILWAPLLLGLGCIPLAFVLKSKVLLFFSLPATWFLGAWWFAEHTGTYLLSLHSSLAIVLLCVSVILDGSRMAFSATPLKWVAGLMYLYALAVQSGESMRHVRVFGRMASEGVSLYLVIAVLVSTLAFAIYTLVLVKNRGDEKTRLAQLIALIFYITLQVILFIPVVSGGEHSYVLWIVATVSSNVLIITHSVLLMLSGLDRVSFWRVSFGFLLMVTLVTMRYFDFLESLLLRSMCFLFVGALLFFIGYQYSKRRSQPAIVENAHA